jgi:hypothetical protein
MGVEVFAAVRQSFNPAKLADHEFSYAADNNGFGDVGFPNSFKIDWGAPSL